jgi:hypothetical protein
MIDLTILYYTANVLKDPFATKVRDTLFQAKGDYPLISISRKPMDFGQNIVVDFPHAYLSIYKQILVGAKAATTEFVALAEDDCLYSKEHFQSFRPGGDEFAYDMARWSIYSWSNPPIFSLKYRRSNSTLIAPRKLLIEALEERFAKYPDESKIDIRVFGEPGRYEKELGVTVRKSREFSSACPCITFSHPEAIGYEYLGNRKKLGELKAFDVPFWGTAENIIKKYYV